MTDTLTYVLASIQRTSENDYSWLLMPHEGAVLIREMERLRVLNADLRVMVDGLETAAHAERAAVVAYLRGLADDYGVCIDLSLIEQADKIERGEHRRGEDK